MAKLEQSRGIVLSALKYGDSGRIVRVYTDAFGMMSFLVNSVGSKRAAVRASMLLPLSLVELVHSKPADEKLGRIKEAKMDLTYTSIPYDPIRNALALFLAELFSKVLRVEESNAEKFDFVRSACLALDTLEEVPPAFHLAVWAQLTTYLGFAPNLNGATEGAYFDLHEGQFSPEPPLLHAYLDQSTSAALHRALTWRYDQTLAMTKAERKSLMEGLSRYMNIHLDGFGGFKSLEVLTELFA
jgi:DNA repair protein RecO (recombination protein O)